MIKNNPNHPRLRFLPDWLIEIQQEVYKHHAHLVEKYNLAALSYDECLGALALEVNIIVDDTMNEKQMETFSRAIMERLVARRSGAKILVVQDASGIISDHLKKLH